MLWGSACLLACVVYTAWPRSSPALDLRVQGQSRLAVNVRSAGTRLIVSGTLRDDLGHPLPRRAVRIQVRPPGTDQNAAARTTSTSRQGTFSEAFDVPPGQYEVAVRFEATSHVTGTSTTESVSVVPEPMKLVVDAPAFVHPPVESIPLSATLLVDGMGIPESGHLEINGARRQSIQFDGSGRVKIDLTDRLEPGLNRIRLIVPEDRYRAGTSAEHRIRYVPEPTLEARVSSVFERLQRGVAVEGTLRGADGPIREADVEVQLRPEKPRQPANRGRGDAQKDDEKSGTSAQKAEEKTRPTREVTTDAEGRFRAFVDRSTLRDGRWLASVRVVPDAGTPLEREVGATRIDRTLTRWIARGAGLLALLAVVAVGGREVWRLLRARIESWRERRALEKAREEAFETDDHLDPVRLDDEQIEETRDPHTVRGRLHDVWRDAPAPDVEVSLERDGVEASRTRTDDAGWFTFESLEAGDYTLTIPSGRFVGGRHAFSVPHDGTLAGVRFDLVPVPLKIRRLYQALVESIRGDDLWGRLSPRDIESAIRDELEASAPPAAPGTEETTSSTEAGEKREATRGLFSEKLRELVDDPDAALDSTTDYLEALTEIVEETYFSNRVYTEETWQLARRLALRLREAADEEGES